MSPKFILLILPALLYSCGKPKLGKELRAAATLESATDLTSDDFFALPSIENVGLTGEQKGFLLQHVYPL